MHVRAVPADEVRLLLDVGRALRAGDPAWVPPLEAPLLAEWAGRDAFAAHGGQVHRLVAEDGAGRPLGRAVACVNPRLPGVGHIGHLEVVDDLGALRGLLDAARAWLRERGAAQAWAPSAGGAHRAHRALVAGFDRPAFLLEPRSPPHLPRLLEACDLAPVHRWATWEVEGRALELLAARAASAARRHGHGLTVDRPDPLDPATVARLHALLDRVWAGHVGYAPLGPDELLETFGGLLALVAPERSLALLRDGDRDVGLGFLYPDHVDAVRALDGDASRWAAVVAAPRPRRAVIHTIALVPEVRGKGGPHVLYDAALRHLQARGYEGVVLALADLEAFRSLHRLGPPTREHALFAGPA